MVKRQATEKSNVARKKLVKKKSNSPTANSKELLLFYHDMLLIRRFEEKAGQLYGMGLIGGFCHLYIGQEAVVVGMQAAAGPSDKVITSYRDHGHMLACGMDANGVMAELTGRSDGYSKGKGGSMHMFSREKNFFGGHGIVGAQIPIGTGLAFASQYTKDGGICHAYCGDGAINQGQIYEAFNMASLWKLPVIYVIENNKYGMGTSIERASAVTELYKRGNSFGIPGTQVNGMDVIEVRNAARRASTWCRAGKGPYILEMKTYRYRGHSMSDPAKYRSKEEVSKVRQKSDPIDLLRERINKDSVATEEQLKLMDKEIKAVVTAAAEFAQQSPEPKPTELFTDVLVAV
jgi:pyruvate dehydrogenase E1 component alpha subunit